VTLPHIRAQWETARDKVWGEDADVHLADLRHEAGSAWEESGVELSLVSKFLGHKNLSTTTRYLDASDRQLKNAVAERESARLAISLQSDDDADHTPVRPSKPAASASLSETVN
jgi:integrase